MAYHVDFESERQTERQMREGALRHPLLEKCNFERLRTNNVFELRPHILHFGGFNIHQEHSQVLRILNVSSSSSNLKIIGPSTQWFKISYDKKGLLAPGMSEDVTVIFTPHEWRYYYDTVKIFCGEQGDNLIVPIHAYPSANDIALPRIIDFGRVPIGTTRSRTLPLTCKIPIQFEYEFTALEDHPDIQLTPITGTIPADGAANVVVTFTPTRHRTARAEMQFTISQFDFQPISLTVVGSSAPDLARDATVLEDQAQREAEATLVPPRKLRPPEKRRKDPTKVMKPPTYRFELEQRTIDGVKVPVAPMSQSNTNFVLNQTAGKLPMRDLPDFIKSQREAAEARRRKAEERLASGKDADGGSEEDGDEDKQALELQFDMAYREVEKYDKSKELKSMVVAKGEDAPTQEDIEKEEAARKRRQDLLVESRLDKDVARADTVFSKIAVMVPESFRSKQAPTWSEEANDIELCRLQVADRFVRAGAKCMARLRAQRRSTLLRQAIRAAGVVDVATCRAWVEAENKTAAAGAGKSQEPASEGTAAAPGADSGGGDAVEERHETLDLVRIPASGFVLPVQLPTATSGAQPEERLPVEVTPIDNFQEFLPVELNTRLDYKVLEYERMAAPPPAAYMRLHGGDARLKAALEEYPERGPCGDELDGAEVALEMPDSFLLAPDHDPMSLLVPSAECRTFVPLPDFAECDPEYRLAQPAPVIGPLETEPLLPSDLPSVDTPWLAAWRRTRSLQTPFSLLDPEPMTLCEAGGTHGPRLGCDGSGERLSFLPIGGLPPHLAKPPPQEGREPVVFDPEPPDGDSYEAARSATADRESALDVDAWRKDAAAETRLSELSIASHKATRDRLVELNANLTHRNKLFPGEIGRAHV